MIRRPLAVALLAVAPALLVAAPPELRHSDVVFMSAAKKTTYYKDYGATWVAWGTFGSPGRVLGIQGLGLKATGDLWALTAGPKLIHADPALAEAVARDIQGEPIEVPWQRDQTFEGTRTYFGCTNAPAFQQHLLERTRAAVKYKPDGLHLDDPGGTYATLGYLGGCWCHHCMAGFLDYLEAHDSPALRAEAGVKTWKGFDYKVLVAAQAPTRAQCVSQFERLPLHRAYDAYQMEGMLANAERIRDEARHDTVSDLAFSVNAYFSKLGSHFLAFTPLITHFVAEVEHHAEAGTGRLWSVVQAYRQAEAVGRPIAATASGPDYAWVKEHNAVNLVKIWIALGYASGQRLMVPHPEHQWCHTKTLGTHWYHAPVDEFAPYYRFVREHAGLFDDHETVGPLTVRPAKGQDWKTPESRAALAAELEKVSGPLTAADGKVWVFPRKGKDGTLVVHLLNLQYAANVDMVAPQVNLQLGLPRAWVGSTASKARWLGPSVSGGELELRTKGETLELTLPTLDIWSVLEFR